MLSDIIDGVTIKLGELFPGCSIYTDKAEQELQKPYFFVTISEMTEKPMLGQRYFRSTGVSIRYIPGACEAVSRELSQVLERLTNGMEYIRMADEALLRGTKMKGIISEEVLDFCVSYNLFVIKEKQKEEAMDAINFSPKVKEGVANGQ